jgi:glycosyltransferase involved in cell wall biosynthesis
MGSAEGGDMEDHAGGIEQGQTGHQPQDHVPVKTISGLPPARLGRQWGGRSRDPAGIKVAFVNQPWEDPVPPSGAIPIWSYEVGRRFVQRGHTVVIYALGDAPSRAALADDSGIEFRFVPGGRGRRLNRWLQRLPHRRRRPLFAWAAWHLQYFLGVARDLQRLGADVVHIQQFSQLVPLAKRRNPRANVVLHMHCDWLVDLDRALVRRRLRHADLVLGCSEAVTLETAGAFPELAARCATVANGVDLRCFRPADGTRRSGAKRVLFVGRVSPEKGVHVLFEAFGRVLREVPDVELELVGAEQHADMIVEVTRDAVVAALRPLYHVDYLNDLRAKYPAVAKSMWHGGYVNHAEMPEKYRQADLVVVPSLSESFGMASVEAMACALPVVAARVGGLAENVVDGSTGLLVPRGDAAMLAGAIVDLLRDDVRRQAMGEAARRRAVALYSWDRIVDRTLELYRTEMRR